MKTHDYMKDFGITIKGMEKVLRGFQMVISIMENIEMARCVVKDFTVGSTTIAMMENGTMVKNMVMVFGKATPVTVILDSGIIT